MLLERGEALLEIHAYLLVESWRGGYLRHVDHLQKESTEWPLTSKKKLFNRTANYQLAKPTCHFWFCLCYCGDYRYSDGKARAPRVHVVIPGGVAVLVGSVADSTDWKSMGGRKFLY